MCGKSPVAPSEIGILLPDDSRYEEAVREVFARAGIPLSGLGGPARLRNLKRLGFEARIRAELSPEPMQVTSQVTPSSMTVFLNWRIC